MSNFIDATFDVNCDVTGLEGTFLTLTTAPEAEGDFMGAFFIGDVDDSAFEGGEFILIPGPPGPPGQSVTSGYALPLGSLASDGLGDFLDGVVTFTPEMSVTDALDLLNHEVKLLKDEVAAGGGGGAGGNGYQIKIGDPSSGGDGDLSDGAVALTPDTSLSEGLDRMNEVLGKLVPAQPPMFPNATLAITGAGSAPRLADGVTDNAGAGLAAGAAVTRVTGPAGSNVFGDVGPGESGTVSVLLNGTEVAARTLTGSGDAGSYSGLVIADQKDYPAAQPGFWKSVDISLSGLACPLGVNKARIVHSGAGQTNEAVFVRDGLTATPAISSAVVSQAQAGALAYSSGVPHYGTGAQLTVALAISNLAGETYYGGDPLTISAQNGVISAQALGYVALGIATPIARQTLGAEAITPVTVAVDGVTHGAGKVQGAARNVNGQGSTVDLSSKTVLVKRGVASNVKVDEGAIPVTGLGSAPNADNAVRVGLGAGDTPAGAPAAWDASAPLAAHEAAVVAGVLGHNRTDYSQDYLPAGPDYSTGRDGAQYATFRFRRASRSTFRINITGAYAGCWVKLPGVSDLQPNAPNGWWNAFKPYDGAGVPGEAGDADAGCAASVVMNGGSGSFQITFGTQSSTNADDNAILVRIKLNQGQQVTALSLTN